MSETSPTSSSFHSPRHQSKHGPRLQPSRVLMLILRDEQQGLNGFEPELGLVEDLRKAKERFGRARGAREGESELTLST